MLIPSRWEEAFPYAGLDALADGVPVLASDRGGLPELVGRDSVLAADDLQRWSSRLRQLWASPEKRQQVGSAGLNRVRSRFSDDAYLEALIGVYRQTS